MKINDLKLFTKVVELGSFTAAANAFDIPRGKVSRKIHELEIQLNAKLFHRTTRSLSLTNSGEAYYYEMLKALEIIDTASHKINIRNTNLKGKIKLGLLPETHELIQPILFAFQDLHPEITLDVRTIRNGFDDLLEQGLDIAFHGGEIYDSNVVAKEVLKINRCLVASPDYLSKHGTPLSIEELPEHSAVCFRWPNGNVDNVWTLDGQNIEVTPKLMCNSAGFMRSATVAGRGIGYLPNVMIQDELAKRKLIPILKDTFIEEEKAWLLHPPLNTLTHASRNLIDFIVKEVPSLTMDMTT